MPCSASAGAAFCFYMSRTPDLRTFFTFSCLPTQGLLAPEGRRVISSLVLTVFTPALFFSKLGSGVGLKEAMQL
eukprot:200464-Pelagomonas_calceolata.AAC.8